MELKAIHRLIAGGENEKVEFKLKANHPDKIIREVVAFANSSGGHLFVGVADNKTIEGLKYPDDDEFVLSKAVRELCKPAIDFEVNQIEIKPGIEILHYQIFEGNDKPYYAFLHKDHRYGKAFVRVNDRSIQASYEVRRILKDREHSDISIQYESQASDLFKYFENHPSITLSQYRQMTGLNKRLASNKLIMLALSGALKIQPQEGEDLFLPAE